MVDKIASSSSSTSPSTSKSSLHLNNSKASTKINEVGWEELNPTNAFYAPSNRNCHSAIIYKKYMIIFAGKEGEGKRRYASDVHILDLEAMTWLTGTKITNTPPEARMGHSACVYQEDRMIVFGGWNGMKVLDDTWILAISGADQELKLSWEPAAVGKASPKRQFHTANIYENIMYVFGGGDGKSWLNDLYALNLDNYTWEIQETTGEKPVGRLQHSSSLLNGKLYIFGGEPDRQRQLNDLFYIDLVTLNWVKLQPLGQNPAPRVSASALKNNNKIYFFGGYDGQFWRNDTFYYDTADNNWVTLNIDGKLPKPRCRHSAVFYNNRLIIFGGNDCEKNFSDLHSLTLNSQFEIPKSTLVTDLRFLLEQKLYCDVVFELEQEEIPAHKGILAVRCERFKEMFESQLSESKGNVKIVDVKPAIFKSLLTYIYSDEITIYEHTAIDLLIAADCYLLTRLKSICEDYLAQRLNINNVIEVTNVADKYNTCYLKDAAMKFLIKNHETIVETQDISKISKNVLVELFKKRVVK